MENIIKVKFEVGGEEVVASGEGGLAVEDDDDAMAEADIDEVLDGDEGLGSVAGAREGEEAAAADMVSLDDMADDEDFFEVSNVPPSRRLSRKAAEYAFIQQTSLFSL